MARITYIEHGGAEHVLEVKDGLSVMEGAVQNDVPGIDADCGGGCACATCHCYVAPEWREAVGGPNEEEAEMLDFAYEPGEGSRLSCQIKVGPELDGLVVRLPAQQGA